MPGLSETERLNRYQDALCRLEPDRQIDKMAGVKSPKNIRRFLSEHAPEGLILRFAHRYHEVMGMNLSRYERGKILRANGEMEEARKHLAAAEKGDVRATVNLAEIEAFELKKRKEEGENVRQPVEQTIQKVTQVLARGFVNAEVHQTLADLYFLMDDEDKVNHHFNEAHKHSRDDAEKIWLESLLVTDANPDEGLKLAFEAASRGSRTAIWQLTGIARERNFRTDLKKWIKLSIQYGNIEQYQNLAVTYHEEGDTEGVLECGRKVLKIGHGRAMRAIATLLYNSKRPDLAKMFAEEMIAAGHHLDGYLLIGMQLIKEGRKDEGLEWMKKYREKIGGLDFVYLRALLKSEKYKEAEGECHKLIREKNDKRGYIFLWIISMFGVVEIPPHDRLMLALSHNGFGRVAAKINKAMAKGNEKKIDNLTAEVMPKLLSLVGMRWEQLLHFVQFKD